MTDHVSANQGRPVVLLASTSPQLAVHHTRAACTTRKANAANKLTRPARPTSLALPAPSGEHLSTRPSPHMQATMTSSPAAHGHPTNRACVQQVHGQQFSVGSPASLSGKQQPHVGSSSILGREQLLRAGSSVIL
ncbi:hypothetical protein Dimus_037237, partial [Dionaea muscipula]